MADSQELQRHGKRSSRLRVSPGSAVAHLMGGRWLNMVAAAFLLGAIAVALVGAAPSTGAAI
ncbi:MAG: hypothetical protein KY456_08110, partial [Chloroflexi bacterium]|nr:hypothetical protein [Chloroflexota bacterium]